MTVVEPRSTERKISEMSYCIVSIVSEDEGCAYFVFHHSFKLYYANPGNSKNKSYEMNTVDVFHMSV